MKTFTILATLVGMLFVTGCNTYRGGASDEFEANTFDTPPAVVDDGWVPRPDRTPGPVIPPP
jgi:hypothetical protein